MRFGLVMGASEIEAPFFKSILKNQIDRKIEYILLCPNFFNN